MAKVGCPECGIAAQFEPGTGRVECPDCGGKGGACQRCHGAGEIECSRCGGTGLIDEEAST